MYIIGETQFVMFFVSYKSDDPLFDRAPVDLYEEQLKGEVSKSRGEISLIEILIAPRLIFLWILKDYRTHRRIHTK